MEYLKCKLCTYKLKTILKKYEKSEDDIEISEIKQLYKLRDHYEQIHPKFKIKSDRELLEETYDSN